MKKLLILGVALALSLSTPAFSRGGTGSGLETHHSPVMGGSFGTNPATPGTNSLGAALSSGGAGSAMKKGPPLGTGNPAVDREDKRVSRIVQSICRGC